MLLHIFHPSHWTVIHYSPKSPISEVALAKKSPLLEWVCWPIHPDHHQGPPGQSHHWHQAHTKCALSQDRSEEELTSCLY